MRMTNQTRTPKPTLNTAAEAPPIHKDERESEGHPYLVATITPGGGMIVHMHWTDRPPEPLAFTNESDFSAWLKGAVRQIAHPIPPGVRPHHSRYARAGIGSEEYQPLPMPEDPAPAKTRAGGLRALIGGGRS
jgi:hypothetical protein